MSEEDLVRKYTEYTARRLLMLLLLCSGNNGMSVTIYLVMDSQSFHIKLLYTLLIVLIRQWSTPTRHREYDRQGIL